MRGWLAAVAVAAAMAVGGPAAAQSSFSEANDAFQRGDYREAVRHYETLVQAGIRNEALFYNLGNAYFRLAAEEDDKLGHAIYYYERALRVAPGFEDAQFNLGVAREAVQNKVTDRLHEAEGDPFWVRVVTTFSIAHLTVAFLALNALFFAALVGLRFMATGFARTGLLVGTVFVAIAGAAAGLLLWGHVMFVDHVDVAIVLPDEARLREGPDQARTDRGQVHAGLRVHLVDREPGWVRVRLANGHEGWLPEDAVGEL